ncbi:hypothetical protein FRC01_003277 [Tulasnella sp. 417]|nr:hypothetical protein FRC01_003277 [Tulasnella sp. 417]
MAPAQSKVSHPTHSVVNPPAVTAPTTTARKASLRSSDSRTLTAQQQLLAKESNKVQQKKHPATGSRKANRQATTKTTDEMFTVVRHTEAVGLVSRGRTTARQGGTKTNLPARNPSPDVTHAEHHASRISHQSPPATPSPNHSPQNDVIVPGLAQSTHVSGNAAEPELEEEDWENPPPLDFRRSFQDQEEEDDENAIAGAGSHQGYMALDQDDMEDGEDIDTRGIWSCSGNKHDPNITERFHLLTSIF